MKVKNILGLAVFSCLAVSCYEDEGNYDYTRLNDIDIVVTPEEKSYVLKDVIKITPKLSFALENETQDAELTYLWTYDMHPISTEKNLNWVADTIATNKELRLAIYDKKTKITYFGSATLSIFSPYTEDGWLILSEVDNKAVLAYSRKNWDKDDNLECVTTRDLYGSVNGGEDLGGKPLSINVHYVHQFDGEDNTGWVWIGQEGGQGCIDLSGTSYQREGQLDRMFLKGHYPEGFAPHSIIDMKYLALAIGKDGTTYTRVKESDLLYNSGYFLERPLMYKEKNVDCRSLAMAPFAEHGGILIYDANSSSYLHLCDAIDSYTSLPSGNTVISAIYSGKLLPFTVSEKDYSKVPSFARFDKMKDYKMHYVGAYKKDWGMGYMSVIEKDNRMYLQNFTTSNFDIYEPNVIAATPVSQEEIPNMITYVNGFANNIFALSYFQDKMPCLFMSCDNALYLSYLKGSSLAPVPFANFNSKITSINLDNNNSRYLSIGLESGDFYIFNLETEVLESVLQNGPVPVDKGVDHKTLLWHESGFGKIVKVLYKNPQNGYWGWM